MKQDDVCCNRQVPLKLHVAHSVAHKYLRWLNNYPRLLNLPFFISSMGSQESICSSSAIQTIIILQNILFLLLVVLLHDSLLLWCDGISLLQRTEEPHFLTRSIQQAWQLFQNISIKANPISLNSTLSLLFPIAGLGGWGTTGPLSEHPELYRIQHQAEKCVSALSSSVGKW